MPGIEGDTFLLHFPEWKKTYLQKALMFQDEQPKKSKLCSIVLYFRRDPMSNQVKTESKYRKNCPCQILTKTKTVFISVEMYVAW